MASHCESLLGSFDEVAANPQTKPSDLSASPTVTCYPPHPRSPFIIIT